MLAHLVIGALHRYRAAEALAVERARGGEIDGRAERAFVDFRRLRLAHGDRVEQLRREQAEVEATAAVDGRAERRAGGGRDRLDPVEAHAREIAAQAAHGDVAPFARVTLDRDAGHALKRFGDVGVWEVGHVLGVDDVDDVVRLPLGVERALERAAQAGDDDFLLLLGRLGARRVLREGRTGPAQDGRQRGGGNGARDPGAMI